MKGYWVGKRNAPYTLNKLYQLEFLSSNWVEVTRDTGVTVKSKIDNWEIEEGAAGG